MEKPQYTAAHLKGMNRHVVYDFIRERATSKAQIVKRASARPPSSRSCRTLWSGALWWRPARCGRRGTPAAAAGHQRPGPIFGGVRAGRFVSLHGAGGHLRPCAPQAENTRRRFGAFLAEVRDGLVSSLLHAAGADPARLIGVGVTLPGTYDPARRVLDYAPAIGVFGPVEIGPWMDGMTQKFGVPVYVENDTNAQCMGEHELCRARDLVYVSAGTGVGAGVMLDGRLRRGETNKCGEIGYNVFFEDYKRTARAAGCLEQRIGYHVLEQQFALDRFSRRSQIPPALLAQMAAQVTKPLALCIANLTHVLDCSTVVLGGEVAELLGDALLDALNARLEELCLSPVRVRRPASADDGLIGMAAHITRMEVDALLEEE